MNSAEVGGDKAVTDHGEILVYRNDDGAVRLNVRFQDETVWLTQAMMAALFGTTVTNVSMHLRSVFEECELLVDQNFSELLEGSSGGLSHRQAEGRSVESLRGNPAERLGFVGFLIMAKAALQG